METLNLSFLDQFSMTELEQRLETDPLAVGQLLTISSANYSLKVAACFQVMKEKLANNPNLKKNKTESFSVLFFFKFYNRFCFYYHQI